jgi:radical SAM superfamily enzyme YgiQ (UPF0313 family)/tetratricopeptide (TPR) repeat protein
MMPTGNPLACSYLKAAADSDAALSGRVDTEVLPFDRFADPDALAAAILSRAPGVVGISTYVWNSDTALALARELKRRDPSVFIVLGGPQVAYRTESFFARAPIDACAVGEGELTFRALLAARLDGGPLSAVDGLVWRDGAVVRRNRERAQMKDLSVIPSPYLTGIVPIAEHADLSFETSRGCPFDCSFCDWQKNQKVRHFPVERVLEEVRLIARLRPDATIYFVDADLFLHKERAKLLLPALLAAAEGTELKFDFETNLGHWDDELLRLADHPRVRLSCGVQSLNPKALRAANRDSGVFKLDLLAPALKRREMLAPRARVSPEVIFGMPDDDLAHYRLTLDWALSARVARVMTTPFLVLPGSPFAERPERWGITFDPRPPHRLLNSATFTESDMAAARGASFAANLGLSLGWHAAEALRFLGRRSHSKSMTPVLDAFESFATALEADGRFPWVAEYRSTLLRSLNFNLSDPTSPAPDEILSRLQDPDELISRDLPEILALLEARAAGDAPAVRFLRAARSRFERRRLSSLDSYRRLLQAAAPPEGRWLVIAPDEDREFFKPWTRGGARISLIDQGDDALRAQDALTLDTLDLLPARISRAASSGLFDGILVSGAYGYMSAGLRAQALSALAAATRPGGRLVVVDDGQGFSPFRLVDGSGAPLWKKAAPGSAAPADELSCGPWSQDREALTVRAGSACWKVYLCERRAARASDLIREGRLEEALSFLGAASGWPAPGVDFGVHLDASQDLLGDDRLALNQDGVALREALALVKAGRRLEGRAPEFDLLEGALRLVFGDATGARAPLDRAVAASPGMAWARHWRGRRRLAAAVEARELRLSGGPALAPLYAAAREDWDAAVELAPSEPEHLTRRSLLFASFDRYDESLRDLQEALRLDPAYDYCLANRAEVLADMDRGAEAVRDDDELVRRHPRAAWAWAYRGRDLGKRGLFVEAERDLDRALRLAPRLAELHAWKAEAARRRGDWAEALVRLDRAARLDPRSATVRLWRARVRSAFGLRREALADFRVASRTAHGLDESYRLLLGETLFKSGRFEEAAREFELVRPASPRQTWAPRLVRGRASGGSREACSADHDAAVAALPRSAWPLILRARLRLEDGAQGRLDALSDLERALVLSPRQPWARAWRGEALVLSGETAAGLRDLDTALRARPGHAPFLALRAEIFLKMGDPGGAARDASAAIDGGAGAGRLYALRGRARAAGGDAAGAEADLSEAVLRGPKLPEWHLERARLLRALGRPLEARDELEAARRLEARRSGFQPKPAGGGS